MLGPDKISDELQQEGLHEYSWFYCLIPTPQVRSCLFGRSKLLLPRLHKLNGSFKRAVTTSHRQMAPKWSTCQWLSNVSILKSGSSGKPQPIQAIQALRKCFNQTTRKKWNLEAAAKLVPGIENDWFMFLLMYDFIWFWQAEKPHANRSKSSAPGLPILLTSESSNCKGSNIFARHAGNLSHKTCMLQSNWWDSIDARSPKYGLCQHAGAKSSNHRCTPRTPGQSGQRRKLQGHVFRTLTFFKLLLRFFFADLQWSTS